MGLDRRHIRPSMQPLVDFNNERVMPVRVIRLKVHATERVPVVDFLVVDCYFTLNAIMGRTWIHSMQVVVSTLHRVMRCQSPDETYTIDIKGDKKEAKKCYSAALKYREKVVDEPIISDQ